MRPEKKAITEEIKACLEGAEFSLLVDYKGMTVEMTEDLRGQLRDQNSRMMIVKNALLKHAGEATGTPGVDGMEGPTAMVVGGDVTAIARLIKDFVKKNGLPAVKGGSLGAQALSIDDVEEMANIPPREVLYAKLAGTLAAPMSQTVGVLQQKLCSLLYVLKAVEEKKNG